MPRKYRVQAAMAFFALAVVGCEQTVTDIVAPPSKVDDAPAVSPFSATTKILVSPVGITANGTFTRTWDWTIDKQVDPASTTLVPGEVGTLDYVVGLEPTPTDSDWNVSGAVTVTLAPGFPSIINTVDVALSGGVAAAVTCPGGLPAALSAPGQSLVCTYTAALPNGGPATATVTVTGVNILPPPINSAPTTVTGTASVAFGAPTEVDECVDVDDSNAGPLGPVCASDPAPRTLTYSADIGPFDSPDDCGDHVVDNTASFTGSDTGATGSADASATVTVECASGPADVEVDIKPGSEDNPINLGNGKSAKSEKSAKSSKSKKPAKSAKSGKKSKTKSGKSAKSAKSEKGAGGGGSLPVAILTTDDFDAATVDVSTVTLGESLTVGVAVKKNGTLHTSLEDVDNDGDVDLVMHFRTADLVASGDLDASTVELCLNGSTFGGDAVHGCDAVTVVGG